MKNNEKMNLSQPVTLKEAKMFAIWQSANTGEKMTLPTLNQLKHAKKLGIGIFEGKEWTSEGWIYNPALDTVAKHPIAGAVASFRLVQDIPPRS